MTVKKAPQTASKKSKTNQPTTSQASEEITSHRVKRILRWSFWFLLKVTLIGVFVLFLYSIYLDGKVRDKFEGQRWQVPVQVFGAVEEYKIGSKLILTNLQKALTANRYKKVTHVHRPGEFALSKNRAIIYRRAFDFGAGVEPANKVTLDIANDKVKA